jgi:hypothetical protein
MVGTLFLQYGASDKLNHAWRVAQFLFPLLAVVTLQAAAEHNPFCLVTLVLGLWKFGFPETMFLLTSVFNGEHGALAIVADLCEGLGTLFHHSSAALIICIVQNGVAPLSRDLEVCIYPLIVQHWFAMLRYLSPTAYLVIEITFELWFEVEVFANFGSFASGGVRVGAAGMLFAHWLYLLGAVFKCLYKLRVSRTDNKEEIRFAAELGRDTRFKTQDGHGYRTSVSSVDQMRKCLRRESPRNIVGLSRISLESRPEYVPSVTHLSSAAGVAQRARAGKCEQSTWLDSSTEVPSVFSRHPRSPHSKTPSIASGFSDPIEPRGSCAKHDPHEQLREHCVSDGIVRASTFGSLHSGWQQGSIKPRVTKRNKYIITVPSGCSE